jgi:hypothetical protein
MDKYLDKLLERKIELETAPFLTDQQKTALVGLNNQIAKITGGGGAGGGNAFTVSVGGKTYTFPTQEAANKFKAEAGVK